VEVPDEYNAKLKTRKAIYVNTPLVYPPVYVIDEKACKFYDCAKCVEVCPTKAVELDQKPEQLTLNVGSIIVATGFREYDPSVIKEYHYGEYPDVITHLELARMIDAFGPTNGVIVKPSDKKAGKTHSLRAVCWLEGPALEPILLKHMLHDISETCHSN
jgi:heterodisulfide reductase subunit A